MKVLAEAKFEAATVRLERPEGGEVMVSLDLAHSDTLTHYNPGSFAEALEIFGGLIRQYEIVDERSEEAKAMLMGTLINDR